MKSFSCVVAVVAAASLRAKLPDPQCKTGVLSLSAGDEKQICCPSYCGECSDYSTCGSVNGQDSAKACCASKVRELSCDVNSADPYCIKSCEDGVPPCVLAAAVVVEKEDNDASADCDGAVDEWMTKAESAVAGVNPKQWDHQTEKGGVLGLAQKKPCVKKAK